MHTETPFKWRHFEAEIILLCVRWHLRYALSYRDLEEIMAERGLSVDHTTIYRWVQHSAPELEKRCRPSTSSVAASSAGAAGADSADAASSRAGLKRIFSTEREILRRVRDFHQPGRAVRETPSLHCIWP